MNTPAPSSMLTPDQMHTILTDWDAHYAHDPLYAHLQTPFGEMAAQLWTAMKNLKAEQEEADWYEQQQERRRYPEYAELGAAA